MYEITKEIMPDIAAGRPRIYPFDDLKKGECFKAPLSKLVSLRGLASVRGRELGRKFSVRQVGGEVGVWRVK